MIIIKNPIKIINIINEIYELIAKDNPDYVISKSSSFAFLHGYCFDFYKILSSYFPGATLMISKDFQHCGTLINGKLYDATGEIPLSSYIIANDDDINFMNCYYDKLPSNIYKDLDHCVELKTNLINKKYRLK